MSVYKMPVLNIDYEVNKIDPYKQLSEGMRRVIDYQAANAKEAFDTNCSWEELRKKYIEERKFWNEGGPSPLKTVDIKVPSEELGDIPVRIFYPQNPTSDKKGEMYNAVFFIHGGGFTVGSIDTHNRMMRYVMESSGCAVIGIDYSLAPEAKFPVPLYECAHVIKYFHENGTRYSILPDNMAIAGDSGGANLALGVNLYLRDYFSDNGYIASLLLYYGTFGLNDGFSWRLHGSLLDGMRKNDMQYYIDCYIDKDSDDIQNPYFNTLNNDLTHGIPATYMCCGDLDPLLDDSKVLHRILQNHGVYSELEIIPGVLHAFMHYGKMMTEAVDCLNNSGRFFRKILDRC